MCQHSKRVFSNTIGEVRRCGCGTVHVTIPGQTLHLTSNAFLQLSALVQESSNLILEGELKKALQKNIGECTC
jgi:hypothetical protein